MTATENLGTRVSHVSSSTQPGVVLNTTGEENPAINVKTSKSARQTPKIAEADLYIVTHCKINASRVLQRISEC